MDELVAAIHASPDDDGPRMVYADWLQQRGDPLGELIAVQCRLAAGDRDFPDAALCQRERELLAAHDFDARACAVVDEQYELRRGFVEHVTAYKRFPLDDETAPRLFEAAPLLHSMNIPGTVIAHPITAAWQRFDAITLRELCYFGEEPAREFARSPFLARLRRFQVINSALEGNVVAALLELPNALEHFGYGLNNSSFDRIDAAGSSAITRYLETTASPLRSIALGNASLGNAAVLARFPLVELGLHNTPVPAQALHALRELKTLELVFTGALQLDLATLLQALPALKRLRVRGAQLETREILPILPHATRLTRLDLAHNEIDEAGVRALCELPAWLHLTHNPISAETLRRVAERNRAVIERPPPRIPRNVVDELDRGNKIAAIKLHREQTGAGLLESKLAIERINDELDMRPASPQPMVSWLAP